MAFVKRADCIVKSKLWRNPFTHATVRAAAYVRNDDYGGQLVEDCVAAVRGGGNLIIFPEGTRTPANGSITLKRGAANIAVRAQCNITPVHIWCAPPMLVKGEKWWRLPSCPSSYRIEVQEDIDIRPFVAEAGSNVLAARLLTDHLQDYFTQEKLRHGVG
jgi:1-acyl-sn-glycerol-3-phosphate acyltransferase